MKGVENLLDGVDRNTRLALQRLLDGVNARDSLAFLEATQPEGDECS